MKEVRIGGTLIGKRPGIERPAEGLAEKQRPQQSGFGKALEEAIERVNEMQARADQEAEKVATGQSNDIHAALVAMQEAQLSLELTVQVVQRAIEAYKEISRMQI